MTPLEAALRQHIETKGPISVHDYMAQCLGHGACGYYITRNPIGARGDFITSPEISQVFGELIGLWSVHVWDMMDRPARLHLIELGPGRGTLMADMLRTARVMPAFHAAIEVHLVETSPMLRQAQQQTLSGAHAPLFWHNDVGSLPEGPAIVIANEFFDALPVRQFIRASDGWRERMVGLAPDGALTFLAGPSAQDGDIPAVLADNPEDSILERAEASAAIMENLAARLTRENGALLAIDYGHTTTAAGDTLQAVRAHAYVDPLHMPGEADLTVHVDFQALAEAAMRGGATTHVPLTQRDFLLRLGAAQRTQQLKLKATPEQGRALDLGLARLTDPSPTGMGQMFKVLAVTAPGLPCPPPFDPARSPSGV